MAADKQITAFAQCQPWATTVDRKLQLTRIAAVVRGRSHIKPGTLLKSQIPILTSSDWNDGRPGFIEIDRFGYDGSNSRGGLCFTCHCSLHSNDGAHVEQKNWTHVRSMVGYLRYDALGEMELLNEIWEVDAGLTNMVPHLVEHSASGGE